MRSTSVVSRVRLVLGFRGMVGRGVEERDATSPRFRPSSTVAVRGRFYIPWKEARGKSIPVTGDTSFPQFCITVNSYSCEAGTTQHCFDDFPNWIQKLAYGSNPGWEVQCQNSACSPLNCRSARARASWTNAQLRPLGSWRPEQLDRISEHPRQFCALGQISGYVLVLPVEPQIPHLRRHLKAAAPTDHPFNLMVNFFPYPVESEVTYPYLSYLSTVAEQSNTFIQFDAQLSPGVRFTRNLTRSLKCVLLKASCGFRVTTRGMPSFVLKQQCGVDRT
jgi:hypothetical protein